jgi:hypothetical protein
MATYTPVTTAVTAKIMFDGFEIGELQDFTAQESYNIKEVYGCGSPIPDFVPGFFSGVINSKKAFIDINMIFTKQQPASAGQIDSTLSDIKSAVNTMGDLLRDGSGAINKIISSYFLSRQDQSFMTMLGEPLTYANLLDIEVKDFYGGTLNLYQDCIIDSRRMTISTAAIIIMEDLTIKFRKRT